VLEVGSFQVPALVFEYGHNCRQTACGTIDSCITPGRGGGLLRQVALVGWRSRSREGLVGALCCQPLTVEGSCHAGIPLLQGCLRIQRPHHLQPWILSEECKEAVVATELHASQLHRTPPVNHDAPDEAHVNPQTTVPPSAVNAEVRTVGDACPLSASRVAVRAEAAAGRRGLGEELLHRLGAQEAGVCLARLHDCGRG